MDDIVTEHSGSILRVQLNRPTKLNAMTSAMYVALAGIFNEAATDENTRVVLWHGAGDSFCAGNDIEDFLKNPPGAGESPQARLMEALVNFDKPVVAAVQGAAIGGGTTMLTHCDFIYAGESTKFQMPFINLAVVPEFGSSCSVPARIGHLRAAELILLGAPFDARHAADLGLVRKDKDVPQAAKLLRDRGNVIVADEDVLIFFFDQFITGRQDYFDHVLANRQHGSTRIQVRRRYRVGRANRAVRPDRLSAGRI